MQDQWEEAGAWVSWCYRVTGLTWFLTYTGLDWAFSTIRSKAVGIVTGSSIGKKVAAWYRNWYDADSSLVYDIEAPRILAITVAADWIHVQPGCSPHAAHLQPVCCQPLCSYATLPMYSPYAAY